LVLTTAGETTALVPLAEIPFLTGAGPDQRLEWVLAAVGAAWALDIAIHVIRTGIETFAHDPQGSGGPEAPVPDLSSRP